MFHIGHLNILQRSKAQCDHLIVGVSTDELVMSEKKKTPVMPLAERMAIVSSMRCVDEVVVQHDKNKYGAWQSLQFHRMFVGSDWRGTEAFSRYEQELTPHGVNIVYLPHTDGISSTILRTRVSASADTRQH